MEWSLWEPKYEWIVQKLNLDREMDRKAAKIMNDLLIETSLFDLKKVVKNGECVIFGAGPSLEKDLEKLKNANWFDKVLISADGATSALIEYEIPDIIVTDLDGNVSDQLKAWNKGSWMIVHAHGDNIEKIQEIVPKLTERVLGTIQVDKPGRLHNFGGFTDGDRAAFLAHELGASKIYLAGMDLGKKIGRYTGQTNEEIKKVKLEICKKLLSWLSKELGANIVNITSRGEKISDIPDLAINND